MEKLNFTKIKTEILTQHNTTFSAFHVNQDSFKTSLLRKTRENSYSCITSRSVNRLNFSESKFYILFDRANLLLAAKTLIKLQ